MRVEKWNDVLGYEGLYKASNFGRIKNNRNKILSPRDNGKGYLRVYLTKDGVSKEHYIHRLVWEAFNGKIPDNLVINHLSEIKSDNSLDNLEVITQKENLNYGTRNERAAKAICKDLYLTHIQSNAKYHFLGIRACAEHFGVSPSMLGTELFRAKHKNAKKIRIKKEEYYFNHCERAV